MRRAIACAIVAASCAGAGLVAAQPSEQGDGGRTGAPDELHLDELHPAELVAAAQRAERAHDPAEAERLYAAAVEAGPNAREARHARRRLAWLRARSEGDYEPLRLLMRLRSRAPSLSELDEAVERVRAFPGGHVQREAWAVIGDGYAAQGEHERALGAYRAWLESPGLSEGEREIAHSKAALSRARVDGVLPSIRDMRRVGLDHRAEVVLLRARWLSAIGGPIAITVIAIFAALGLWLTRGRGLGRLREALAPRRLGLALWLCCGPVFLVRIYDRQLVPQIAMVMAALAAALLLAAIVGEGRAEPRWRKVLAFLGASAVLAAAFLALDRSRLLFDLLWSVSQARH
jgi:hypothetical protein